MHTGLPCIVPAHACSRHGHVNGTCGLPQGAVGLSTNPVIANSFAGLATSATAFAAIEVHHPSWMMELLAILALVSVVESFASPGSWCVDVLMPSVHDVTVCGSGTDCMQDARDMERTSKKLQ